MRGRQDSPVSPRTRDCRRREEIARVRAAARSRAEHLLADHPMWVAGVVLYWAEGAKSRNRVSLANSDPRTLRLFVAWVRRYLNQDAEFSLHLHLHEGNDERAARRHWREVTGLDRSPFINSTDHPSSRRSSSRPGQGIARIISHTVSARSASNVPPTPGTRSWKGSTSLENDSAQCRQGCKLQSGR